MSDPNIPLTLFETACSTVFAVGAAWATLRGRIAALKTAHDDLKKLFEERHSELKKSLEGRVERIEDQFDVQTKSLGDTKDLLTKTAVRLSDISELKGTVVRADVFEAKMEGVVDALNDLRAMRTEGSQAGLPPVRARQKSRPGF